MKYSLSLLIGLFCISTLMAFPIEQAPIAQGPYLGQTHPGLIPKIFVPGLICQSGKEHHESNGTFSGDGKMFCFLQASGIYISPTDRGGVDALGEGDVYPW